VNQDSDDFESRSDVHSREKNRLAARKWRDRKDRYLLELENANDDLRRQVLECSEEIQCLNIANRLLEKELGFFQAVLSRIAQIQS
jgi:hypothetical protein